MTAKLAARPPGPPADLVEQVESVGRLYAAVASSARRLVVTRPALSSRRGTADVSRFYRGPSRNVSVTVVVPRRPAVAGHLAGRALRGRIADLVSAPSDLEPAVDAARPHVVCDFDRFHGNLRPDGEQLVWDIRDRHLSRRPSSPTWTAGTASSSSVCSA